MRISLVTYSGVLYHNRASYALLLNTHAIACIARLPLVVRQVQVRLRFPGREQFPLAAINFGVAEITVVRFMRHRCSRKADGMTSGTWPSRDHAISHEEIVDTPRERVIIDCYYGSAIILHRIRSVCIIRERHDRKRRRVVGRG